MTEEINAPEAPSEQTEKTVSTVDAQTPPCRRKRPILPYVLVLIFILTFFTGPLFFVGLLAEGPHKESVTVVIPRGTSVQQIGAILKEKKTIIHPVLFLAASSLMANNHLKAGEYKIDPGLSVLDIAALMRDGICVKRQFTVPEGLTSREIVALLQEVEGLRGSIDEIPEEGSLMPETYFYNLDNSRADIIKRMQNDQRALIEELWKKRQEGIPLRNPHEAVILASIIEKETGMRAQERSRVAGVFVNRLRRGMPLQSDPTVIYALTKGEKPLGRPLLRKDLDDESPYNTYVKAGFPPGPICNPGRAALQAALNPERNDFFYFVADGTGGHAFSKTLQEHNKNVSQWRNLNAE